MSNKQTTKLLCLLGAATMFTLTAAVQADTARIPWSGNKHIYQRFDQSITWDSAQGNCQAKGANLVTVTSAGENGFVKALAPNGPFWIGASDASVEGRFSWVTGEKWAYEKWYSGNSDTADYVSLSAWSWELGWNLKTLTDGAGYICEWSVNNYIDLASVPDLNGNGIPEMAALYVDYVTGRHTVKITDPKTDKVISTLHFKNDLKPPQGLVVLKDINGNKVPEIGVLYIEFGQPSVGIKDAKNDSAFLNTLHFLDTNFNPKAISLYPDINHNGYPEISVLGVFKTNNTLKAETRDSQTGAVLNDTKF